MASHHKRVHTPSGLFPSPYPCIPLSPTPLCYLHRQYYPNWFGWCNNIVCLSQWPRGLRRGSAAVRLLRLWVLYVVRVLYVVSVECGQVEFCVGLITRPEESYRLWCVVVCDLDTSWMRRSWPTAGNRTKNKQVTFSARRKSINISRTILPLTYFIHLPMKMEPIVSSETSAIRTRTPGNYPKRNKLRLEHGESLKTRINKLFVTQFSTVRSESRYAFRLG